MAEGLHTGSDKRPFVQLRGTLSHLEQHQDSGGLGSRARLSSVQDAGQPARGREGAARACPPAGQLAAAPAKAGQVYTDYSQGPHSA